jgi:signal transduction histidine kinase
MRAALTSLREAVLGPPPASAVAVVDRGAVSFALVWQALWLVADPAFWPTRQASLLVAGFLLAPAITWAALLAAHLRGSERARRWARVANVGSLFVALAAVLLWEASQPVPEWSSVSNFAALPAGLAGLLFGWRVAWAWVAGVVVLEVVAIFQVAVIRTGVPADATDLLYPGLALTTGVLTIAARHLVMSDAVRADAAASALARAEADRLAAEGVERALRREERVLHETVLNTLTAVSRGGLGARPHLRDRLTQRCAESAQVLRDLRQRTDPELAVEPSEHRLDRDLMGCLLDLGLEGVSLDVDCAPLDAVPPVAYDALRTATREALSNVQRHAEADHVTLRARVSADGPASDVQVEIVDDGRGFDPRAASGLGLLTSVRQAMADVDGSAEVESTPGEGTRVSLRWRAPEADDAGAFLPSTIGFAVPVLVSFGLYSLAVLVAGWPAVVAPLQDLAAFALAVGLGVLVVRTARRGPVPGWVVVTVTILSAVVYALQTRSTAAEATGPWVDWSSGAIAALFLVVIAIGPGWAWLVVVPAWLVIQGDVLHEVVAPGTAVLLAAALFGRSTRRYSGRIERIRREQAAQETALAVARDSVFRMRRRYAAMRESTAIALLDGLASGALDPDDPEVRRQAALEERFIRTLIRVDPSVDDVHALATSLAVRARRRGLFLDVDVTSDGSASGEGGFGAESLSRAVDCAQPGEQARFTAGVEGDDLVIRLVVPVLTAHRQEMMSLAIPGIDLGPATGESEAMLWEIRRPTETAP